MSPGGPTPEDARAQLAVIRRVMGRARSERSDSGPIYVVWGLVMVACIAATLGADALGWPFGWVAFPVLGTVAGGWSAWHARARDLRRETYGGRVEGRLWMGILAAVTLLLGGGLGTEVLPLAAVVPVVACLTAVGQLTSAGLFGERLLDLSAAAFFVLAGVALWFDWRTQYALFGVTLLVAYVLPGAILVRRDRERDPG